VGCRAGCGAQDGDIVALGFLDQRGIGLGPALLFAQFFQLVHADQTGIVVFAHAARVVKDDLFNAGDLLAQIQQLVDLLLILGDDDLWLGGGDQIFDLSFQRVAINAQAHRPAGVRGDFRPYPFGPIVADIGHHIAFAEAQGSETQGNPADMPVHLGPGERLPDAEFFFALGNITAVLTGIVCKQFRQRVKAGNVAKMGGSGRPGAIIAARFENAARAGCRGHRCRRRGRRHRCCHQPASA